MHMLKFAAPAVAIAFLFSIFSFTSAQTTGTTTPTLSTTTPLSSSGTTSPVTTSTTALSVDYNTFPLFASPPSSIISTSTLQSAANISNGSTITIRVTPELIQTLVRLQQELLALTTQITEMYRSGNIQIVNSTQ